MTKNSILLIDDEPDITFTIKNILEDNGFKVDSFNDPTIALKSYRVNFYDLVILDIKMPKMDGFELYIKIIYCVISNYVKYYISIKIKENNVIKFIKFTKIN